MKFFSNKTLKALVLKVQTSFPLIRAASRKSD